MEKNAASCLFTDRLRAPLLNFLPGLVRIKPLHCLSDLCRILSEILLVHHAVLVDNEGRDAGVAVLGRIGHQRESADHLTVDDIIVRTAGSMISPALSVSGNSNRGREWADQ